MTRRRAKSNLSPNPANTDVPTMVTRVSAIITARGRGRDSAKDPSGAWFKIGLIFVKLGPRKFRIIALSRRANKMKKDSLQTSRP